MRCKICDAILSPDEIKYDPKFKEYDPCNECLEEIKEVYEDHLEEHEIRILVEEELEGEE